MEWLAALIAFGSLMAVILGPSKPRLWQESLGDFKMVYASAEGLAHSGNAYSFDELTRAFKEGGVVRPESWYGHSPVYPPFTLLALSPLLLLPLVPAAYVWACLSYLAMAGASVRLARYAQRTFNLPLGLRLLLIALMAASPLVSFGLELANLSVVSACCCVFAATGDIQKSGWLEALALSSALVLKPHLAFWIIVALFFLPRPNVTARRLALRSLLIFAGFLLPMAIYLACRHETFSLMAGYIRVLRAEAAGGSMDVRDHQVMAIPAQITSLGSLLGYWMNSTRVIALLEGVLLIPLTLALAWASPRVRSEWKSVVITSWSALGLLATYHRAHDGTVLLLMVPWLLARLWQRWHDLAAWALTALYVMFSIDIPPAFYVRLSSVPYLHGIAEAFLVRQVAMAAALLFAGILLILLRSASSGQVPVDKKRFSDS